MKKFKLYIVSPNTKIYTFDFQSALTNELKSEVYDLIVFDMYSELSYDVKRISLLRKEKLHKLTPFLYLLGDTQSQYKMDIYSCI